MNDPRSNIERGYAALRGWLQQDPALEAEFRSSAAEFFGPAVRHAPEARELAERRHVEWFVLERESRVLGGLPIQVLGERADAAARGLGAAELAAWLGSFAGVFEVTSVRPGDGIWLRDLAGAGEYPLAELEASQVLEPADLLAGRIFPVGEALFQASPATVFLRDARLLGALRADFDRARARRRGVLRVAQREIESLFHAAPSAKGQGEPVAQLRALLQQAGLEEPEVEEIVEELAQQPFDPERLVPGAGDVLGAILDHLAFETDLDLESARRALIAAWEDLSTAGPGTGTSVRPPAPVEPPPAPDESRVAEALAEFDRARASGVPLEPSFAALERALNLPQDGDSDEDPTAPDFPGAIAAIVEEFLWEMERTEGAAAAEAYACLRSFGRFAQPIGVLDNLDLRTFVDYAARWTIDNDELKSADEAHALIRALERFQRWSVETQAVTLDEGLGAVLALLARELPRIIEANQRRTRRTEAAEGVLFELLAIERDQLALRTSGGELKLAADPLLLSWLRPGDLLRGNDSQGRLAVYACYPNLDRQRLAQG